MVDKSLVGCRIPFPTGGHSHAIRRHWVGITAGFCPAFSGWEKGLWLAVASNIFSFIRGRAASIVIAMVLPGRSPRFGAFSELWPGKRNRHPWPSTTLRTQEAPVLPLPAGDNPLMFLFDTRTGFEPVLSAPKTDVLPLHYRAYDHPRGGIGVGWLPFGQQKTRSLSGPGYLGWGAA